MRQALITRVSKHMGHVGPNLGLVEATVALHRVFDSPADKIVFDVSHQCYPHKMLTGRMQAHVDEAHYDDVSGYAEPSESPHDHFIIGHTATSVSLATGLAKARDLRDEKSMGDRCRVRGISAKRDYAQIPVLAKTGIHRAPTSQSSTVDSPVAALSAAELTSRVNHAHQLHAVARLSDGSSVDTHQSTLFREVSA